MENTVYLKGVKKTESVAPSNSCRMPSQPLQWQLHTLSDEFSIMRTLPEPGPENHFLGQHAELLITSFQRLTGKHLIERRASDIDTYRALFEAPFCVVSHGTEAEPVFNYGNRCALNVFEMSWLDFTNLPSKESAQPANREERTKMLAQVSEYGFIDHYRGVRISASGRRFQVEDAVVWNLLDEQGIYRGQAAALFQWSDL